MRKLKVVLMGTTDFAVPALDRLVEAGHDVISVVCQPDRPNQRGKKIRFLPVKQRAIDLGIPVFQPEKIRTPEGVAHLKSLNADLFVVAAYGQILSAELLEMPPMGAINIHGSLLPEYRGAAPIHHAIIDGKMESGVTIMKMDIGMDTGDMLAKVIVPITDDTTVGELHDELAQKGADLLIETINGLQVGRVIGEKQDDNCATYATKVDRETGKLDWTKSTAEVLRRINGTDPFPGAYTLMGKEKVKCFRPKVVECKTDAKPGTVLAADTKLGLVVKTGNGALGIEMIQMPGKRRMASTEYFRGNQLDVGMVFGD